MNAHPGATSVTDYFPRTGRSVDLSTVPTKCVTEARVRTAEGTVVTVEADVHAPLKAGDTVNFDTATKKVVR